jgi:hypothetical protein
MLIWFILTKNLVVIKYAIKVFLCQYRRIIMEKIEMKKEYTKENIDYVSKLLLGKPIEFEGLKI